MVYRTLEDMITYLEHGTKLHIGVLFYGNYGNEMCKLPHSRVIHYSFLCNEFKTRSKKEFNRCFACRNLALKKALLKKEAFDGVCINGIYEYTRPVVIDGDVVCIIYIGNYFDKENKEKLYSRIGEDISLIDSLEKDLTKRDIETICDLIEGHIITLLEKYKESSNTSPLIENIKNYILSNLDYDISISLIAEMFHYNKLYLGRLFKKETGKSITDYINLQRLKYACQLLVSTNQSIISIANRTGFNNVTYFNRLFKNVYGVSPKIYRTQKSKSI